MTWEKVTLIKKDALRVWEYEKRATMGAAAADDIAAEMRRLLAEKEGPLPRLFHPGKQR